MSVTIVTVSQPKDGYDISLRLDGALEYRKYYRVICSGGGTEAVAAIANDTTLTPQLGDGLGVTITGYAPPLLRQKNIKPMGSDNEKIFILECIYNNDNDTSKEAGSAGVDNPLEQPYEYEYGAVQVERAAIQDTAGVLVVNSAGDIFDPPLMMSLTHPLITIKCNVPTTKNIPALILSHTMTLNNESVTINGQPYDAYSLRLNKLGATKAYYSATGESGLIQTPYYKVTMEIESVGLDLTPSQATWDTRVLDVGYNVLDNAGNKIKYIDEQGKEPAHPVFLKNAPPADVGKYSSTPTYKDFIMYKSATWSSLPLNEPA